MDRGENLVPRHALSQTREIVDLGRFADVRHDLVEHPALDQAIERRLDSSLRLRDIVGGDYYQRVVAWLLVLFSYRLRDTAEPVGECFGFLRGQRQNQVAIRDLVVPRRAGKRLERARP